MRIASDHPLRSGGYFHSQPAPALTLPVPQPKPEAPPLDCSRMLAEWAAATTPSALQTLSERLGVSFDSLTALGCSWAAKHRAWAFPMSDGYGNPIGIRLRNDAGEKWAVKGSRNGIFLPQSGTSMSQIAFVTEGPTDTAAALTIGLFAIGRPSCCLGGMEIRTALKRLLIRRAIMVLDNDAPGETGGVRVASELQQVGIKVAMWTPPAKDMRDFVKTGGSKLFVDDMTKNLTWK